MRRVVLQQLLTGVLLLFAAVTTPVEPHSQNLFKAETRSGNAMAWTHVRLSMFPDGGIARFRVYGQPRVDFRQFLSGELIDLAAINNGGFALSCSDSFFKVIGA